MRVNVSSYIQDLGDSKDNQRPTVKVRRLDLISNLKRPIPEKAKLPSYSACLKAQIKPQNFRVLKDYYELVVKDFQLAKLNKTALLSKSKQSL